MGISTSASVVTEKSIVIQKREALPATINKLKSFVIFQEETCKNYKSRLLLLKETNAAKAQVDATFEDALKISEMLFQAYERLGELVEQHTAKPKESGKMGGRGKKGRSSPTTLLTIGALAKELNVSASWLEQMKLLSRNPQIAKNAIKSARDRGPEAGTPPTKTEIITSIRSAERQSEGKHRKDRGFRLERYTETILEALKHLDEGNWPNLSDIEVLAFNDAIFNFQQRLGEFQRHVNQGKTDASRIPPSVRSKRLQPSALIQCWTRANSRPFFLRMFATARNRRVA